MSVNKISDNVGKKIVDALKMQNIDTMDSIRNDFGSDLNISVEPSPDPIVIEPKLQNDIVDEAFNRSLERNIGTTSVNYDYPSNVAVLNTLMSKLPAGVSRQTAAVIITQTMEALGISMNSVIQEAQQVQDDLASRARNCQKDIIEYRQKISELENQTQQYQKQVIKINDIISLFAKTQY